MVCMHLSDFLDAKKLFYGLLRVIAIPSTLIPYESLLSIPAKLTSKEKNEVSLLEILLERIRQTFGGSFYRTGKPLYGIFQMLKLIIRERPYTLASFLSN